MRCDDGDSRAGDTPSLAGDVAVVVAHVLWRFQSPGALWSGREGVQRARYCAVIGGKDRAGTGDDKAE